MLFHQQIIQVIKHPDGEAVGLRGVNRIAEVVPVIIRNYLIQGIDRILPYDAEFAAGGKVPDELQVDREGIELMS